MSPERKATPVLLAWFRRPADQAPECARICIPRDRPPVEFFRAMEARLTALHGPLFMGLGVDR